jgi:hypothetical protein
MNEGAHFCQMKVCHCQNQLNEDVRFFLQNHLGADGRFYLCLHRAEPVFLYCLVVLFLCCRKMIFLYCQMS